MRTAAPILVIFLLCGGAAAWARPSVVVPVTEAAPRRDVPAPKAPSPRVSNAGEITFVDAPPQVGLMRKQDVRLEMSLDVEMQEPGKAKEHLIVATIRKEELIEKVTAVTEGRVRAVGISYHIATEEESRGGVTKRKSLPQAGKAYVLERGEADAIRTRYADGDQAPPGSEQSMVLREAHFFQRDPIRVDLLGKTMRLGESAPFLERGVLRAFSRGKAESGLAVRRVSAVLNEIQACGRHRCARFALEVDLAVEGRVEMETSLKGALVVQDHGAYRLLLLLGGPVLFPQPSENQPPASAGPRVDGRGTMRVRLKNQFEVQSVRSSMVSQ